MAMFKTPSNAPRPWALFLSIALVDCVILAAATIVDIRTDHDFYLACGICIAAIMLFVGMIYHALTVRKDRVTDGVRDAIACTFILVYLLLVVYTLFFKNAPANTELFPQTSTLLSSFTSVAAVVVGFYFATGSLDKFIESRKEPSGKEESEQDTSSRRAAQPDEKGGTPENDAVRQPSSQSRDPVQS